MSERIIKDDRENKSEKFVVDLNDMEADSLPDGLEIEGSLNISNNQNILSLKNIKIKGDLLLNSSTIQEVGPNVTVGEKFDMNNCKHLIKIHENITIKDGGLISVNDCTNLETLPKDSYIGGNFYATNCPKIKSIPDDLIVKYALYLRHTRYAKLINSKKLAPVKHDFKVYCKDQKV